VYGEELEKGFAQDRYLLGQLHQEYDSTGLLTNVRFDFKGNPERSERRVTKLFVVDQGQVAQRYFRDSIEWNALEPRSFEDIIAGQELGMTASDMLATVDARLDPQAFLLDITYDALSRVTTRTTPDGSVTRPTYNAANLLEQIHVQQRGAVDAQGAPAWTTFVESVDYNARGQRLEITYGDAQAPTATTTYGYDPETFRLIQLTTHANGRRVQDLSYTYDPVGNITEVVDAAQQTVYFGNAVVEPRGRYRYDSLYQLVQAEGREHPGQQPIDAEYSPPYAIPNPNRSRRAAWAIERHSASFSLDPWQWQGLNIL
jgi:YD repeat-containing protein